MSHPLKEAAAGLPDKPGVYLFKNARGEPVYIGKARSLVDRVKSYFQPTDDPKVRNILAETVRLDFILTASEREAAFLENNFIHHLQPKFNLRLKDDKSFPYLRLMVRDSVPGLFSAGRSTPLTEPGTSARSVPPGRQEKPSSCSRNPSGCGPAPKLSSAPAGALASNSRSGTVRPRASERSALRTTPRPSGTPSSFWRADAGARRNPARPDGRRGLGGTLRMPPAGGTCSGRLSRSAPGRKRFQSSWKTRTSSAWPKRAPFGLFASFSRGTARSGNPSLLSENGRRAFPGKSSPGFPRGSLFRTSASRPDPRAGLA